MPVVIRGAAWGGRSLLHRVERLIPCSAPVIILSFLPYPVPCLWQAWSLICKPRSKRPILNYDVYTLIRGCKVAEETLQLIPPTANLVRKSLFNLGSPSYRNLLKTHISLLESSCYFEHSTCMGQAPNNLLAPLHLNHDVIYRNTLPLAFIVIVFQRRYTSPHPEF